MINQCKGARNVVWAASVVSSFFISGSISLLSAEPVGAPFLTIDPAPRTASMGNGGSAIVSNASAFFLNPAGLASSKSGQIFASHTELFEEQSFDAMSFSHRLGTPSTGRTLGVNAVYLSGPAIERRTENRAIAGSFRASDLAMGVSYGQRLGLSSVGVTLKAVQQKIDSHEALGFAADLGIQRATPIHGLRMGASILNLGTPMKFVSERYSLPTTVQVGLGYAMRSFNFVADARVPVHGQSASFSLGTEFVPVSLISLRAGYLLSSENNLSGNKSGSNQLGQFAGFAAGIGLRLNSYQFDYAMVPHQELGQTQKVGFSINFR